MTTGSAKHFAPGASGLEQQRRRDGQPQSATRNNCGAKRDFSLCSVSVVGRSRYMRIARNA
jgi:hypothetical protein